MRSLATKWVIVKPKGLGIFLETLANSQAKAWSEFYLGGVCEDAVDSTVDCVKKGYTAKRVKIIFEDDYNGLANSR